MEKILFESEIFNKDMHETFPFRIRVTETITNNTHMVQVLREEFRKIGDDLVVKNQSLLNGSAWKE